MAELIDIPETVPERLSGDKQQVVGARKPASSACCEPGTRASCCAPAATADCCSSAEDGPPASCGCTS